MYQVPCASTWPLNFQVLDAFCQKVGKRGIPEKGFANAIQECLFQVGSAHPIQELWPKHDKGNVSLCILPCKIGDSRMGRGDIRAKYIF